MSDRELAHDALTKVPAVTLGFWIIKILATTLGETGGDTVTMTWLGETTPHPVPNGYLIGTAIFGIVLVALVIAQIKARNFNPWLYWATIVASTTCGTTLADFADRSLGIGYPGGSLLLLSCVLLSLFAWYKTLGTVDVNTVTEPREETILAPRLATHAKRRRSKATGTPLSAGLVPNALWCTDFKGEFKLGNHRYCYPLTVTDHASRFLLQCSRLAASRRPYTGCCRSRLSGWPFQSSAGSGRSECRR